MKKTGSKKKTTRVLIAPVLCALLMLLLALGILCVAEEKAKTSADPGCGDAVIVLGAQVKPDGTPSRQLEGRLNAALKAYMLCPRPVVVCGGQGTNEPCTEASVMKNWLTERGVPEENIFTDESSVNTYQNIRYAMQLLPKETKSVLVVTSDYHLPRALSITRDAGLEAYGLGAETEPAWFIKNHLRELLAWGKYLYQKVTGAEVYLP